MEKRSMDSPDYRQQSHNALLDSLIVAFTVMKRVYQPALRYANKSLRAALVIVATAGCFSRRSAEMA